MAHSSRNGMIIAFRWQTVAQKISNRTQFLVRAAGID